MRMRQINGSTDDAKEILPGEASEHSEEFSMARPIFDSKLKELTYK